MKMLLNRTVYFDQILQSYTFFEVGRENVKEKKKYKEKQMGHAWIQTTVHRAVGLTTKRPA